MSDALRDIVIVLLAIAVIKLRRRKLPVGTVTKNTERFDLKTLEGAYVIIRRMSYGEKLERQDAMLSMRTSKEMEGLEVSMLNKNAALRDFGKLVVDHNITDENDRSLNFKDAKDVFALDPRIGDEIGQLIDSINSFEETEQTKN